MGYLHIENLYKNQTILLFKECYALEKIHGTSAHILWEPDVGLKLFSGGEKQENFENLFDKTFLISSFLELDLPHSICVYGEAYGGKCQGMKKTYGEKLKFVAFDVNIGYNWLDVESAERFCNSLNIDFVPYRKILTDIDSLNAARDAYSMQAKKNGIVEDKIQEGIVLRPLIELIKSNGSRVIAKYKRDEFRETKKTRELTSDKVAILRNAEAIAEEWVTEMRLKHIIDKLTGVTSIEMMPMIIKAMIEDVYREGKCEIEESADVRKAIGKATARIFKRDYCKI